MNIAVVTVYTPDIANYGEISARNKRDYAAIHGYEFIVHRQTLDASRPPMWCKILAIQEAIKTHDWVFWTDADALIMNFSIRLEDLIDDNYDLIISNDKIGLNNGHMLIRSTPAMAEFLKKTYAQTDLIHHLFNEQEAMSRLIKTSQANISTKFVEQRVFNSYLENYQPGDFIIHCPRPLIKAPRIEAFNRRTSLVIKSKSELPQLLQQFHLKGNGIETGSQRTDDFQDSSLDFAFLNDESQNPRDWLPKVRFGGLLGGCGVADHAKELAQQCDATLYIVDQDAPIWYFIKSSQTQSLSHAPVIHTSQSTVMPRIMVQGWRAVPHPFAIVNQYQILEMLRRPELFVSQQDLPFPQPHWRKREGILAEANEIAIFYMPEAASGANADVTYRIAWPFDFTRAKSGRTVVFAAADARILPPGSIAPGSSLRESSVMIVTPSNWSRDGLIAGGADPARIRVIPFGVDLSIFRPARAGKLRRPGEAFLFHYVAGTSIIENLPMVLRALATVAERYPQVRLALRGVDGYFPIRHVLQEAGKSLTQAQVVLVQQRLLLGEEIFALSKMAEMYQHTDVLLSPTSAGAFEMPVLEAAACGAAIISTAGGASDEIVTDEFALRISSRATSVTIDGCQGTILSPDFDHFINLMRHAIESPDFLAGAAVAGPRHAATHFSWQIVVNKLLEVLLKS